MSREGSTPQPDAGSRLLLRPAYKHYVLAVLTLVLTVNLLDRGLMILLLQPIKEDLHLSDTQAGLLTGIVFGLFYATLGIPIARIADRKDRVLLTSLAMTLWSITVSLCIFVVTFPQLVLARMAAAIGEAGSMPPTYSLLGDYFPQPGERTKALAYYWLANPLASLISLGVGGWINQTYGWRMTFLVMALPALLVAVLVKTTVQEPRLLGLSANGQVPPQGPAMCAVLRSIWCRRTLRHLTIAIVTIFTMASGLGPWYAAFLIRSHGLTVREAGTWLGLGFGLCGILGTWLGGYVSSRQSLRAGRTQMRVIAAVMAMLFPMFIGFLMAPGKVPSLLMLIPLVMVFNFFLAPTFALLQRLVPADSRATVLAVVLMCANLIGMGIGPEVVGLVSDALRPSLGNEALRYSMLCMSLLALVAANQLRLVARTVDGDLLTAEAQGRASLV